MPRYRTFHHLEEYLVSNLPYRTYSISLKKAEPRSEEGVHKEGEETVMIKLVDQEDLRVRKEREGKLALEEKKAGGQLHSNIVISGDVELEDRHEGAQGQGQELSGRT